MQLREVLVLDILLDGHQFHHSTLQNHHHSPLVSKIVQGASFEKMKQHASRSENASRLNSSDHLRVGKTGTWRDHFAPYPGLEEKFREVFRKRMAGPGLAWNVGEGDALATPIVLPA